MAKTSFKKLINSDIPVLIDFYADWCGPCKTLGPIVQEVKDELGDEVRIVKIDVDKNNALSNMLKVMSIPTMIIYRNGDQKWRESGVRSKAEIIKAIKSA